jgi:type I restriction enzyme S subunit
VVAFNSIQSQELKQHIRDKGVVLYSKGKNEWRETSLNKIINIIGGGTPKTKISEYWNGDIPWLSVVDFNTDRKFVFDTEKKITQAGLENSSTKILNKGHIIISARGTVGVVAILGKDMAFNQLCYGIRAIEGKSTNDYVYYLLTDAVLNFLQISHGGVFDTITKSTFKEIKINLPELPEQKAIAEVLSSLDDKIDLLNRQNKTLEEMAETLFRQWFVEEAEDDLDEVRLSYFAENIRDTVRPENVFKDETYIGLEHIERRNIALNKSGLGIDIASNKYRFSKNNILFGKLRPYFHKVCFTPISGICSTDILVIRPKKLDYFAFCLFAFYQSDVIEYVTLGSEGTRMPRTNWNMLGDYIMQKPSKRKLNEFNKIVLPLIEKIKKNLLQIKNLNSLRDTLLPKLMSGMVQVKYND